MKPLVAALLACAAAAGCGSKVGDTCQTNVDCSPLGDRFCDTSEPGGYCSVEGCDVGTCPDEAVCVRFFQPLPSKPCNPTSAVTDCGDPALRCLCDCGVDQNDPQRCLPSMTTGTSAAGGVLVSCNVSEAASAPQRGHCAPESSERRWCQRRCKSASDCRDGYECRQTGTHGSEPVPDHTVGDAAIPVGPSAGFCVRPTR